MTVSPRKSVGRKRLMALVKYNRSIKPDRFDFSHWCMGTPVVRAGKTKEYTDPNDAMGFGGPVDDEYRFYEINGHACGTTACALGHGAFEPSLRKLGLRIIGIADRSRPVTKSSTISGDVVLVNRKGEIITAYVQNITKILFGISEVRTNEMFFPSDTCPDTSSNKEVADHIVSVIKEIDTKEGWKF